VLQRHRPTSGIMAASSTEFVYSKFINSIAVAFSVWSLDSCPRINNFQKLRSITREIPRSWSVSNQASSHSNFDPTLCSRRNYLSNYRPVDTAATEVRKYEISYRLNTLRDAMCCSYLSTDRKRLCSALTYALLSLRSS